MRSDLTSRSEVTFTESFVKAAARERGHIGFSFRAYHGCFYSGRISQTSHAESSDAATDKLTLENLASLIQFMHF